MKLGKAKIIFMGTSFFAKEVLRILLENKTQINLVVTQPDKPAGRKKDLKPSEVKIYSQEKKLSLKQFSKLSDEALSEIKKINPDLVIVAAYGMIIPQKILDIPKLGFINVHTSLLPKLRGPSPIQTALLEGFKETGVTIMEMDAGVDTGDILSQKKVSIASDENYSTLEKKLIQATSGILNTTLEEYYRKEIESKKQNSEESSETRIIKKQDGKINWKDSAEDIYRCFKAYYEWPKVYTFWNNQKLTLIEISKTDKENSKQPGEVYQAGDQICVKTSSGSIVLNKVQLAGKKELLIKDFLNGHPKLINSILN